jgi:hypothetical protein
LGEQDEGAPVTGVDGEILDELLIDDLRNLGALYVENRGRACDLDSRGGGLNGEGEVDGQSLADKEVKPGGLNLAETCAGGSDFVVSWLQKGGRVNAVSIGCKDVIDTRIHICHRHNGIGQDRFVGVGDRASD